MLPEKRKYYLNEKKKSEAKIAGLYANAKEIIAGDGTNVEGISFKNSLLRALIEDSGKEISRLEEQIQKQQAEGGAANGGVAMNVS